MPTPISFLFREWIRVERKLVGRIFGRGTIFQGNPRRDFRII